LARCRLASSAISTLVISTSTTVSAQPATSSSPKRLRRHRRRRHSASPFTEAKEVVAGFYLIEADTLQQATEIASRIPSASLGTIEVRPCRQLLVEGRPLRWG
jgi:hypothetical protein